MGDTGGIISDWMSMCPNHHSLKLSSNCVCTTTSKILQLEVISPIIVVVQLTVSIPSLPWLEVESRRTKDSFFNLPKQLMPCPVLLTWFYHGLHFISYCWIYVFWKVNLKLTFWWFKVTTSIKQVTLPLSWWHDKVSALTSLFFPNSLVLTKLFRQGPKWLVVAMSFLGGFVTVTFLATIKAITPLRPTSLLCSQ